MLALLSAGILAALLGFAGLVMPLERHTRTAAGGGRPAAGSCSR